MMRPGNVGSSACADDEYLKTDAQSKPRLFEQKKSLPRWYWTSQGLIFLDQRHVHRGEDSLPLLPRLPREGIL